MPKPKAGWCFLITGHNVLGFSSLARVPAPQTAVWTETWWLAASCLHLWIKYPSWDVHLSDRYHSKPRHSFFSRRQIWAKSFISAPNSVLFSNRIFQKQKKCYWLWSFCLLQVLSFKDMCLGNGPLPRLKTSLTLFCHEPAFRILTNKQHSRMFTECHPSFRGRGWDKEAPKVCIDLPFMCFPGIDGATCPLLIRALLLSMSGRRFPNSRFSCDYAWHHSPPAPSTGAWQRHS